MKRLVFSPCDTFCADTEENKKRYNDLGYTYIDKLSKTDGREDTQHFLVATTVAGREVSYSSYILNASFRNFDDLLGGINFDKVVLPKHKVDELTNLYQSHLGEVNSRELLAKIEHDMNRKLIEDFGISGYHYKVTGSETSVNCILHRDIDNSEIKVFPNTMTVEELELSKRESIKKLDTTIFEITASTEQMIEECGDFIMSELSGAAMMQESKSIRVDLDKNGVVLVTIL